MHTESRSLEPLILNQLRGERGPGESYNDPILRLVAALKRMN